MSEMKSGDIITIGAEVFRVGVVHGKDGICMYELIPETLSDEQTIKLAHTNPYYKPSAQGDGAGE